MKYVTVISARAEYEEQYPYDTTEWKKQTFLSLREREGLNDVMLTNLIVMGDAEYEMDAGEALAKTLERCLVKSVKMQEFPTPEELLKEI